MMDTTRYNGVQAPVDAAWFSTVGTQAQMLLNKPVHSKKELLYFVRLMMEESRDILREVDRAQAEQKVETIKDQMEADGLKFYSPGALTMIFEPDEEKSTSVLDTSSGLGKV